MEKFGDIKEIKLYENQSEQKNNSEKKINFRSDLEK
jgi:hypothetical protein